MNILVNIGVKNYDDDENNDKSEDIKNGLLNDFNDLIFFGFSENPFKAPNLSFDRRFKTVFWFRTTVTSNMSSFQGKCVSFVEHCDLFSTLVLQEFEGKI